MIDLEIKTEKDGRVLVAVPGGKFEDYEAAVYAAGYDILENYARPVKYAEDTQLRKEFFFVVKPKLSVEDRLSQLELAQKALLAAQPLNVEEAQKVDKPSVLSRIKKAAIVFWDTL